MRSGMQIVFQDPFASLDPTHERGRNRGRATARVAARDERRATHGGGARACSTSVGLGAEYSPRAAAASFPAGSASAWRSRAPWCSSPNYWCATKRSARSMSRSRRSCSTLFEAIKREHGTSIVFVSHNLAVVRRLCERVLVMYLGRVVEEGPTEEVFRRAAASLYAHVVRVGAAARSGARTGAPGGAGRAGRNPSAVDRPSGCAFRTRCPDAWPTCARFVQSRKPSRNPTRWPACGGATS